ncbi:MAG: hypothetical protein K5772_03925 [Clostridia bacterium]|nr:hypothetical protein [Clostridia bacterium]
MKTKRVFALLIAFAMIAALCSCGGDTSGSTFYHVTVNNNTGDTISDIRMVGEDDDQDYWFEDLLEEDLYDDGSAEIANTVEDDYAGHGLRFQFYNAYGDLLGEVHNAALQDGDFITVYFLNGELQCALNQTYDELGIVEEVPDDGPEYTDWGLYPNYAYGDTPVEVVGGMSVTGSDSGAYVRVPASWSVVQNSYTPTGDGNCIIDFTATCVSDGIYAPALTFQEANTKSFTWNIVDRYYGAILTENEEDTFYSYNYEVFGKDIHVEYKYNWDFERQQNNTCIFTLNFSVRMPEDYDGLLFVGYNTPVSVEIRDERNLIYEGQIILPIDDLPGGGDEIRSGVICQIN